MIRGTKRRIEPADSKVFQLPATLHNRFDFEVYDAETGELKDRARAFNVICGAMWTRIFNYGTVSDPTNPFIYWKPLDYFNYIVFGSGTGDVSTLDTELFNRAGAREISSSDRSYTADFGYGRISAQAVVTLQAEEEVGTYLREVGIGYDNTHIVTHALLQDMNGNPISLMKGSSDVVKIYATIYVEANSINGVSFAAFTNITSSLFGYICGLPMRNSQLPSEMFRRVGAGKRSGAYTASASSMIATPNPGDHKITITNRIAAGELNFPIRSLPIDVMIHTSGGSNQPYPAFWALVPAGSWYSPPKITGEAIGTGDGTTTGFASAFPMLNQGRTVYVDGVEQSSGVTARYGPADITAMEYWMDNLVDTGPILVYENEAPSINSDYGLYIRNMSEENGKSQLIRKGQALSANGFSKLVVHRVETAAGSSAITIMAGSDRNHMESIGTFTLTSRNTEIEIPAAHQNHGYWQFINAGGSYSYQIRFVGNAPDNLHNVVFDTPPAAGAVITLDYYPACIAKDENHVFDFTLELYLNRNTL